MEEFIDILCAAVHNKRMIHIYNTGHSTMKYDLSAVDDTVTLRISFPEHTNYVTIDTNGDTVGDIDSMFDRIGAFIAEKRDRVSNPTPKFLS